MRYAISRLSLILFFLVFQLGSVVAEARPAPPDAPEFASGPFEVSYTASSGEGRYFIQQRGPGITGWSNVYGPDFDSGSVTISGLQPGVYEYRVYQIQVIYLDGRRRMEPEVIERYSDSVQVRFDSGPPPVRDPLAIQYQYQFQVRAGDINADSRTDLLIQRVAGGDLDNGVLAEALLMQSATGDLSPLNYSSAQLATAKTWPVIQTNIDVRDVNVDGYVDVILNSLSVDVYGAKDVVAFSSGELYTRNADGTAHLDANIDQFSNDLSQWLLDPSYFDSAVTPDQPGYRIEIFFEVGYCYSFYGFPICASSTYVIYEREFTLEELGLDGFLGKAKSAPHVSAKTSSGTSVTSAGYYISSQVHQETSETLTQYGISSLIGNSTERATASGSEKLAVLAPDPITDPEVLFCVVFCGGEGYYDYYGNFYYYRWIDRWTPITIPGGDFDSENYSQDAFDLSGPLADALAAGELVAGSQTATEIADILERVLGSEVLGGILSESGVTLEIEIGIPEELLKKTRLDRVLEVLRQVMMGKGHLPGADGDTFPYQPECPVPLLCSSDREERIARDQPPPRGTFFFPGAGFDGAYINDMVLAYEEAGIDTVNSVTDSMSFGTVIDALSSAYTMREDLGGLVFAQPNLDLTDQFNLVGYSYGSLVAAQTAAAYARNGNKVDHLVLIGCPISLTFLAALEASPNVREVIVINLTEQGDPIKPGISPIELTARSPQLAIQMSNGEGHFYYAPLTPEGNQRRRELAQQLYDEGLR